MTGPGGPLGPGVAHGVRIKVVIADDEPLIRAGIRMILTSDPAIEVAAEAANGREAIEAVRAHGADVVLLDIQMPVMDGLTALAELRRSTPAARVIILTTFGERENVLRALEHGGAGFLLKDTAPAELIAAVRAAAAGDAYLSPGATRHVVDQLATGARRPGARRRGAGWRCCPRGSGTYWRCSGRACPTRTPVSGSI